MRRRSFLLTAFGAAAGAGLLPVSGCAAGRRTPRPLTFLHASLPTPPHPSAAPTAFGEEAVWPLRIKEPHHRPLPNNAAIETVHGTLLLGKVHNDSSDPLSGDSPIIVDLTGPTTYAVVPDSSEHGYRIEEMTPPYRENRLPPSPGALITDQLTGASACDGEFAYVITGSEDMRADQNPEGRARVSLLKIRLSDRTITASTILGENLDFSMEMAHHFSIVLTPDGGSLLVTSSFPERALRLSTADLSVQFDLASVTSQRFSAMTGGEAVALNSDNSRTQTAVVTLADGLTHPLEETLVAWLVHQGYLYATRRTEGDQPFSDLIIDLATGEHVELQDLRSSSAELRTPTMTAINGFIIRSADSVQVRRNGSATALLTWKPNGQEVPRGVAICGSVLYVAFDDGRVHLVNLDTGEVIQESKTGNQYDYGELVAVTPYGACYKNNFYPATAWQG